MNILSLLLLLMVGAGQRQIIVPDSSVPVRIAASPGHFFLWSRKAIFELKGTTFAKFAECKSGCSSVAVLGDGRLAVQDGDGVAILGPLGARKELPKLPPGFWARGIAADGRLIVAYGSIMGKEISGKKAAVELLRDEYTIKGDKYFEAMPSVQVFRDNAWHAARILPTDVRGTVYELRIENGLGIALTRGHVFRTDHSARRWENIPPKRLCQGFKGGDCGWKDGDVSAGCLWLVGTDGFLAQSSDGGVTWKNESLGKHDFCQVRAAAGFAVIKDCDGGVWKFLKALSRVPVAAGNDAKDLWMSSDTLWVLTSDSALVETVTVHK
jgi:hypothetical protein